MIRFVKILSVSWLCLAASMSLPALAGDDVLRLPIGDPDRRDVVLPVTLDALTDTETGQLVSTRELVQRLAETNILFVGESHTNMDFHRAQAQVIRALHATGRQVLIGLEMFPYTRQTTLDRWTRGQYSEAEFLDAAKWYESWGYRWEYYADIFRYARDNGIRMFGVNAPRDVITTVRTKGFEGLSANDQEHVPTTVEPSTDEHRRLFLSYFEEGDSLHTQISEEQLSGMVRAQTTWDAVMGWNAMQAVRRHGGPDAIIVVLIGSGHVAYDLGSVRQIRDHYAGGIATLIPVPIAELDGRKVDAVQASYANFVWGLPPVTEELYPSLGISLAGALGSSPNKIIQVSEDSVAAEFGIQTGELLVSVGGMPIVGLGSLREAMAAYNWGDTVPVEILRNEKTINLDLVLRRKPGTPAP